MKFVFLGTGSAFTVENYQSNMVVEGDDGLLLIDCGSDVRRSATDLGLFLENAPRDWIFTRSSEHTQSLRVRSYLSQTDWETANLSGAARAMNMTPRTLMRRLDETRLKPLEIMPKNLKSSFVITKKGRGLYML